HRFARGIDDPAIHKQWRAGVGERTMLPPFPVRGWLPRQNGPSSAEAVSVAPALPLLCREPDHIREQDGFIVRVMTRLPDAVEEVDDSCILRRGNSAWTYSHPKIQNSKHACERVAGVEQKTATTRFQKFAHHHNQVVDLQAWPRRVQGQASRHAL